MKLQIPSGYKPLLNPVQTEKAIKLVKDYFQTNLSAELKLRRVTAPLFVLRGTGERTERTGCRSGSFPG